MNNVFKKIAVLGLAIIAAPVLAGKVKVDFVKMVLDQRSAKDAARKTNTGLVAWGASHWQEVVRKSGKLWDRVFKSMDTPVFKGHYAISIPEKEKSSVAGMAATFKQVAVQKAQEAQDLMVRGASKVVRYSKENIQPRLEATLALAKANQENIVKSSLAAGALAATYGMYKYVAKPFVASQTFNNMTSTIKSYFAQESSYEDQELMQTAFLYF